MLQLFQSGWIYLNLFANCSSVLGMEEIPKPANLAKRGGCWFKSAQVHVHLGVCDDFRPAIKAHPAFIVGNLEEAKKSFKKAGVSYHDDEPLEGYVRTYVYDPFGNRIEIMQII